MYCIYFKNATGTQDCPVKGCEGSMAKSMGMRIHFLHRHVRNTVIFLEEGNLPRPRYPLCDLLVTWAASNIFHPNNVQCAKVVDRKQRRLSEEDIRAST